MALTVAGSDPSGGAGIQADLRMFSAHRVYGLTVVTALTAQNFDKITAVEGVSADLVRIQLETLTQNLPISALKTGMLWSNEIVIAVAEWLARMTHLPSVIDPVMVSTSGVKLVSDQAIEAYKSDLIPQCCLVTPNTDEAQVLLGGGPIDQKNQADATRSLGDKFRCAVLLKGGHLAGDPVNFLWDGNGLHRWKFSRLKDVNTHGSGCMLSASITARLATGDSLIKSVASGLNTVYRALDNPISLHPNLRLAGIES